MVFFCLLINSGLGDDCLSSGSSKFILFLYIKSLTLFERFLNKISESE